MKKILSLLLACVLLLCGAGLGPGARAAASSADDALGVCAAEEAPLAANARSRSAAPAYCLYCSRVHTGFSGKLTGFFHGIAYIFCMLFHIEKTEGRMRFSTVTIHAGADAPFRFLHISDTHLTLCDERDDAKKQALAKSRYESFPFSLRMLDDAQAKANELGCFIVHTGDIIDFISEKNLERVKQFTEDNDVFATAGNHEFYRYIFGESDTPAQREANLAKVQSAFGNDIRFAARQVNGVNIVAIDNGFYHIDQWQLNRLKEEMAKGMPILLCLHVPLYAPDIYDHTAEVFGRPLWMMSVPEALMGEFNEDEYRQQKEDAVTHEAYELITNSDCIKAIFAGHMHYDFVSQVTPTLKQYIVNVDAGNIVEVD